MTTEKTMEGGTRAVRVAFVVCLAVVAAGCLFYWALPQSLTWGDRANAVAPFGALLSAAAVFAALWSVQAQQQALAAQREDLELQRKELRLTREEMKRQLEEMQGSRVAQQEQAELAKKQLTAAIQQVAVSVRQASAMEAQTKAIESQVNAQRMANALAANSAIPEGTLGRYENADLAIALSAFVSSVEPALIRHAAVFSKVQAANELLNVTGGK